MVTSAGAVVTTEKNSFTSDEYDITVLGDIARSIFRYEEYSCNILSVWFTVLILQYFVSTVMSLRQAQRPKGAI